MAVAAQHLAVKNHKHPWHLVGIFLRLGHSVPVNNRRSRAAPPHLRAEDAFHAAFTQAESAVSTPLWVADARQVRQSVFLEHLSGLCFIRHMDQCDSHAFGFNRRALPGQIGESLTAEGAAKMPQKYKDHWPPAR